MKSDRLEKLRAEILTDVAAHAAEILTDHHIPDDVAEQAGAAIADHLADHWGGQVVPIPKNYAYKLATREIAILAEFAGNNISELALKYDMTERGLRKLLARAIVRQRDLFQAQLFE